MKIPENNQNEFEEFLHESEKKIFNSIDEITKDILMQKDKAIAVAFTKQIGELLRKNGVAAHFVEHEYDELEKDLFAKHYGVLFDKLDFTEHDAKFKCQIKNYQEKICDLVKERDELKEAQILLSSPIEVAQMLITASREYETNSIQRALGAGEKSVCNGYSILDLRQIAEHLLVYCNNNDGEQ